MSTRKERRMFLKEEKKKLGYKMSNKEKQIFHESTLQIGKNEHTVFVQRAESVNSELEGRANYAMYENILSFCKDEATAMEEYKKRLELREKLQSRKK
jgi:hypothetical protein